MYGSWIYKNGEENLITARIRTTKCACMRALTIRRTRRNMSYVETMTQKQGKCTAFVILISRNYTGTILDEYKSHMKNLGIKICPTYYLHNQVLA